MLEAKIERKLTEWCGDHGILARKYETPGRRGAPDHIYFYEGKVALIEFKQPGKFPEELQQIELDELRLHMIPVNWFDDVEIAKQWLIKVFKIK